MDEQVHPPELLPDLVSRATPPAPRRRGWLWLGLVAVLAAAIGVALWLHPWSAPARAPRPEVPQAVGVAPVTKGDLPIILSGLGTVSPIATVSVQTQISGQLIEVGYKEGQLVKKGDFLAQIDPRPYQVALSQAQGVLAHDQGLLDQARTDLARYQTLARQDSIAKQQVDTQFYLVRQYEGTVQADLAAVDTQKLNLAYTRIVAPVDGRVGLRLVDPGNYIQTGASTPLVVITTLQPITVIFTLPEDVIAQILPPLRATGSLPVTAYDRANAIKLAEGSLTTIDNVVDVTTGTFKLRATFPNADEALFPNQFVNVRLLVTTLKDALLLPNAAIQTGTPGTYVYLLNADNTVSMRPVKLGASDGANSVILSGLAPGDRVVNDGSDRLKDGAKVMVPAARGPAGGTRPADAPSGRRREGSSAAAPATAPAAN